MVDDSWLERSGLDMWLMTGASDAWSSWSFWILALYSWRVNVGIEVAMTDAADQDPDSPNPNVW